MAGIGVRLNRIFEKNTLTTDFLGFAYSTVATIAPMMVIIISLVCMEVVLGFDKIGDSVYFYLCPFDSSTV